MGKGEREIVATSLRNNKTGPIRCITAQEYRLFIIIVAIIFSSHGHDLQGCIINDVGMIWGTCLDDLGKICE